MSFVRSLFVVSVLGWSGLTVGCSSSSSNNSGSDGGSASLCASKCARSNAAQCGDQATCESECEGDVAAVPASCKGQLDILAACATTATYTCVGGHSQACDAQINSLNACITSAPASMSTPDAGAPNSGGMNGKDAGAVIDPALICTSDSGGDPCFACDQASCCSELKSCLTTANCLQVYLCASSCVAGDSACLATCAANAPPELVALTTCQNTKCAAACSE